MENQFNLEPKPQNSYALNVGKYNSKDVEDAENLVAHIVVLNAVFLDRKGANEYGPCYSHL